MDRAAVPPFPHYTWLAHPLAIEPPRVFERFEHRLVTHRLLLTVSGDAQVIWTTGGSDVAFRVTAGDIGFYPCDHAVHGLAITAPEGYRGLMLLLPQRHLGDGGGADDGHAHRALRAIPVFRDALMQASLLRITAGLVPRDVAETIGDEIAARQIVDRLCVVTGVGMPAWPRDGSCFSPADMRGIVARVDGHLAAKYSLEDASAGSGLSPSHFAKKFRQSTGLSLNRFMNMRRVGASLAVLAAKKDMPLAQLSLDLGFCSQSHFTRLFRGVTGLTPHRFSRVQHRDDG